MDRTISAGRSLKGEVRLPGDKSISHRALILAAMAEGPTGIENLAPGADVRATWRCLMGLGVSITSRGSRVNLKGLGWRGLREPRKALEAENSGTTMRLLMGVVAGNPILAELTGDDSLRRRPMRRVAEPLRLMGAAIDLSPEGTAPLKIRGTALRGIDYLSPVASAQVKSAVLLAGLLAAGETSVTEPALSRDHTERILPLFGISPRREGLKVSVTGGLRLCGTQVVVPGDPSSAAFWVVAATLLAGSELHLLEVGSNPTRTGYLTVLERMGAKVLARPTKPVAEGAEPVADLLVRPARLRAADIAAAEVPGLIDEVPILALAATQASGVSRFRGLKELRHKESDRLVTVAALLNVLGAKVEIEGDDLIITGPTPLKGARVRSAGDHRIAMTGMVAGAIAGGETTIEGADCVDISYPLFYEEFQKALAR